MGHQLSKLPDERSQEIAQDTPTTPRKSNCSSGAMPLLTWISAWLMFSPVGA